MRRNYEGPSGPATLGTTAKAHLLLRVWCNDCQHQVDIDPGEQAERLVRRSPGARLGEPSRLLELRQSAG
jgi:hypothetical protein